MVFCAWQALASSAPESAAGEKPKDPPKAAAAADEPSKAAPAAVEAVKSVPAVPLAPETVLVKVAGKDITQADLDAEITQARQMMKNRGASPQQFDMMLKHIKPQILDSLIVRKLVALECEREKITVTPAETAAEIESFTKSMPRKLALEDFLKQNGITRETFEKDVAEQIKIDKLLKVTPPTDKEIQEFYEENKAKFYEIPETVSARHVLVAFDAADDAAKKEAKKKKAAELREKLVKGADFAKVAEENSDCPSKFKGGRLEAFPRGQMVPAFEEVAFSLKTNEISGVVETEFGYHVIQNLEHNPARTLSLDEVKGQIAYRLKNRQVQQKLEPMIAKLRESSKVEFQKDGEDLKMPPPDDGFGPMMTPDRKDGAKDKVAPAAEDGKAVAPADPAAKAGADAAGKK